MLRNPKWLLVILFISFFKSYSQNQSFIKPIPNWVKSVEFPTKPESTQKGGEVALLIDRQVNFDKEEVFIHNVILLTSINDIEAYSTIQIDFDPSYQKAGLNRVGVYRDGKFIDKIVPESLKLITREENADRKLYDNSQSLILHLKDIRKGDILEYGYAIQGNNPAFKEHQFYGQELQYSISVEHLFYRVLSSRGDKLKYDLKNKAEEPVISDRNGLAEYLWDLENIAPIYYDNNIPSWYLSVPYVFFSDMSDWNEVKKVAEGFYELTIDQLQFFKSELPKISTSKDSTEIIQDIIRFVQDEVRYLGFEDGLNAFKPHNPVDVYKQRFGDCKDKSFLLTTLMKAAGVEAYPMLVNTYMEDEIENRRPSPYMFNHCVAVINRNETSYYVDPTLSDQGGDLNSLYFPNYARGLIIDPASKQELISVPRQTPGGIEIYENIKVDENKTKASVYTIKTVYRGRNANHQRSFWAVNQRDYIQKEYLKYYSYQYPYIKANEPIDYDDDREDNVFITFESYLIDSLWIKEAGNPLDYIDVYPLILEDHLHKKISPQRKDPYYLNFPVNVSYMIKLEMPEEWNITPDLIHIEADEYDYRSAVNYSSADYTITVSNAYRTRKNVIKAKDFQRFLNDHEKMFNDINFRVSSSSESTSSSFSFSSFIFYFLLSSILGVVLFFFKRIYIRFDPTPEKWVTGNTPIGGWVILPIIGLFITPLHIIYLLGTTPEFFNVGVYSLYFNSDQVFYSPLTAILMFLELSFNFSLAIFSILALTLLFQKRTSFPKLMVWLYIFNLSFNIFDQVVLYLFIEDTINWNDEEIRSIFRSLVSAAIWIPFFLSSSRVKEIFNRQRDPEQLEDPLMEADSHSDNELT